MIYYIADLHLGHKNILKLCNRPFNSIEEHDKFIMDNWNAIVTEEDEVYIIGDLCYRNSIPLHQYLEKLKGIKHLIIGNHDEVWLSHNRQAHNYFASISPLALINDKGLKAVLCHYPMAEWDGYHKGWYHIHGHIHNKINNPAYNYLKDQEKALNAGVNINNFMPVKLKEIIANNIEFKKNI